MKKFFLNFITQKNLSWFNNNPETTNTDDDLVEIPDTLETQWRQYIQCQPCPKAYQTNIQDTLTGALETWQQNLEASNSLIILSNPVEAIAKIVNDSLQNWCYCSPLEIITPLTCIKRPANPLSMMEKMQQAFKSYDNINMEASKDEDDQLETDCLEQRTTLIIIPSLDQCFLRYIDGWQSIIFLRDIVAQNPHCFWVIGCNHWAWNFLDFVCQVKAYFNQVYSLPTLDKTMLQNWLKPMTQMMIKSGVKDESKTFNLHNLTDDDENYWESLASECDGVSTIASNLWLKSLRIKSDELNDNESSNINLQQIKPSCASLPSLIGMDYYLLHSVLIHGYIDRAHLALSLGEPENQLLVRIQKLLHQGILQRNHNALLIQPMYYAKLKNELANNNFFVAED